MINNFEDQNVEIIRAKLYNHHELFHRARCEREQSGLLKKTAPKGMDQLADLESLSSWVAGILSSDQMNSKIRTPKIVAEMKHTKAAIVPHLQLWLQKDLHEFPATAAYGHEVLTQFFFILSVADQINDNENRKQKETS